MNPSNLPVLALGITLVIAALKTAGLPSRFAPILVVVMASAAALCPASYTHTLLIAVLIASAAWGGHHFVTHSLVDQAQGQGQSSEPPS